MVNLGIKTKDDQPYSKMVKMEDLTILTQLLNETKEELLGQVELG